MKLLIYLIIPLSIFTFYNVEAQSLRLSSSITSSKFVHFNKMFGFDLGYNQKIHKNFHLGIFFSKKIKKGIYTYQDNSPYNNKIIANFIGIPNNSASSLTLNIDYNFSKKDYNAIFLGISTSLNNLNLYETLYTNNPNPTVKEVKTINVDELKKYRPGIGINFSPQQKIGNHLWVFVRYSPSLVFYSKNKNNSSIDPSIFIFHPLNIGLKYMK